MLVPDNDASLSPEPITYIVNVTVKGDTDKLVSKTIHHPNTTVTLTEFSQYSTGTISVQARNLGASSKIVNANFRMVNISGEGGATTVITFCKHILNIGYICNKS